MFEHSEIAGLLVSVLCLGTVLALSPKLQRVPGLTWLIAGLALRTLGLALSVLEGAFTSPLFDVVEHGAVLASTLVLVTWVARFWWRSAPRSGARG